MFDELISDTENLKKLSNELVDIGLSDDDGNNIKITRGMMLSVYMHLMNEDNVRHIMSGGITVPETKSYYKGDMKKAFAANSVLARGISIKIENINKDIAAVEERLAQARSDGADTADIEKELKSLTDEREKIYDSGEQYIVNLRESIENKLSDYEKLCQLRSEMLRIYYHNREKRIIRQYEYENFVYLYEAYKALKGNSFIDKIYKEVQEWEVIT